MARMFLGSRIQALFSLTVLCCSKAQESTKVASSSQETPPQGLPAPASVPTRPTEVPNSLFGRVLLTVVNAEIAPTKPTGEPWHAAPAKNSGDALAGMAAKWLLASSGVPGAIASIAGSAFANGASPDAGSARTGPAPFVRLSWGNERVVTPAQWNTVLPSWEYRMIIDPPKEGPMILTVIDLDSEAGRSVEDPIGTLLVEPEKFRHKGVLTLGPFGALKAITFVVGPVTEELNAEKRGIAVDGRTAWTKSGVNVIAGQAITVAASGQVAPNGRDFNGPEGLNRSSWKGFSRLRESPHGGLLIRIGERGPPVFVGAGGTFRAAGAGEVECGPNDVDLGNNAGAFQVDLSIR